MQTEQKRINKEFVHGCACGLQGNLAPKWGREFVCLAALNHKYIIDSWRSKATHALQSFQRFAPNLQKDTATHAAAQTPLWHHS